MITIAIKTLASNLEQDTWAQVDCPAATIQIIAVDEDVLTGFCLHAITKYDDQSEFDLMSPEEKNDLPLFIPTGKVEINLKPFKNSIIDHLFIMTNGGLTSFDNATKAAFARIPGFIPHLVGAPKILAPQITFGGSTSSNSSQPPVLPDPSHPNIIQVTAGGLTLESLKVQQNLQEVNHLYKLFESNKIKLAELMGPQFNKTSEFAINNLVARLRAQKLTHGLAITYPNMIPLLYKCIIDIPWCTHKGPFQEYTFPHLHPCMFLAPDLTTGSLNYPKNCHEAVQMFTNMGIVFCAMQTKLTTEQCMGNVLHTEGDMSVRQALSSHPLVQFFEHFANLFRYNGVGGVDRGLQDTQEVFHVNLGVHYATIALQLCWRELVETDFPGVELKDLLPHIATKVIKPLCTTKVYSEWLAANETILFNNGTIPTGGVRLRSDQPTAPTSSLKIAGADPTLAARQRADDDMRLRRIQQQAQRQKEKRQLQANKLRASSQSSSAATMLPTQGGFGTIIPITSTTSVGAVGGGGRSGGRLRTSGDEGVCFQNIGNIFLPSTYKSTCSKPRCAYKNSHYADASQVATSTLKLLVGAAPLLERMTGDKGPLIAKIQETLALRPDA